MLRSTIAACAVSLLVTLFGTNVASAQGWLDSPEAANGQGFRVGNLELHPGLGAEFGYDSNVFYEDTDPTGSAVMRLTGHLNVNTAAQEEDTTGEANPRLRFSGGLSASYFHFFSGNARNNVGLDAHFDLTIRPQGKVAFRIYNEYGRTIRPFVDRPGEANPPTYARNQNVAGVELTVQSRRRVVAGTFGYELGLNYFEDDEFSFANNLSHQVSAQLTYRFFPNTALISRTTANFQTYLDGGGADAPVLVQDSRRVNSAIGLNGALSNAFSVSALVGYTAGFFDGGDQFDTVTLTLGTQYRPKQNLTFGLMYRRSVEPSALGNFTQSDRLSLKVQMLFGSALLISADVAVSFDESGRVLTADGMAALGNQLRREDIRLRLGLFGEYRFTSYLALNLSVGYLADFTDFEYNDPSDAFTDPAGGYQKFDVWAGLRVFY